VAAPRATLAGRAESGVLILAALVLLTLPLTGLDRWTAWLDGLRWFSQSQPLVPRTFYGMAPAEYVPGAVALGAALVVIVLALLARGRTGLARVGVATVVGSPSLYAHGFTVALPALLELRAMVFWTAIALTSASGGPPWFAALGLVVASWFVPVLRRQGARLRRRRGCAPSAGRRGRAVARRSGRAGSGVGVGRLGAGRLGDDE
jgi:hypothetical protein